MLSISHRPATSRSKRFDRLIRRRGLHRNQPGVGEFEYNAFGGERWLSKIKFTQLAHHRRLQISGHEHAMCIRSSVIRSSPTRRAREVRAQRGLSPIHNRNEITCWSAAFWKNDSDDLMCDSSSLWLSWTTASSFFSSPASPPVLACMALISWEICRRQRAAGERQRRGRGSAREHMRCKHIAREEMRTA